MKKTVATLVGICLLLSSCVYICGFKKTNCIEHKQAESRSLEQEGAEIVKHSVGENISFSKFLTYELNGDKLYLSNELKYTITDVRVITDSLPDNTPLHSFLWGFDIQTTWDKQERNCPEGINEDGSLVDGYYMVLLDIQCENIDARLEDNEKTSYYGDPYVFRAEGIMELYDYALSETNIYHHATINYYYNEKENFSQHPCLFRVGVGEKTRFVVGFLNFNPNLDVSKLKLYTYTVNKDKTGFEEIEYPINLR